MSLILDALTRAEREKRSTAEAPDLLAQPQHVAPAPSRRRVLLGVAVIALLLALLGVVYVMLERPAQSDATQTPVAPEAATSVASGASSPVEAPSALRRPPGDNRPGAPTLSGSTVASSQATAPQSPSAAETGQRVPVSGPDPAVDALYAAQGAGDAPDAAKGGRDVAADGVVRNATESTAAADDTPAADDGRRVEEVVDLERVLREVRAQAESDALAPHPTPLLGQLSKQFRDSVPTLMYLRHDFSSAGPSTVLINGESLRAGQRTRGVEVREVLPDSVILRFAGTEFRLRALNSWVNL